MVKKNSNVNINKDQNKCPEGTSSMFAALNVSEEVTALDAEEHTRELQVRL